jgi:hypothetical protein
MTDLFKKVTHIHNVVPLCFSNPQRGTSELPFYDYLILNVLPLYSAEHRDIIICYIININLSYPFIWPGAQRRADAH